MTVRAAVVEVRGTAVALVAVAPRVVREPSAADGTAQVCCALFPGMPIVLVSDEVPEPVYYGRSDVVRLARLLPLAGIEWRTYP
jgi:hypothetical protein